MDSAVSAALLKRAGYQVTGAFIKIWQPEFTQCTWKEDRVDAMRVCVALGIPYREVDLSDEYKREVVDAMVRDYAAGITPNPDVLCNRSIKFGHFKRWALEQGADMVATGHYAQVKKSDGTYRLMRGADREKDQSYFLHLLDQDDLAHTLFPIGAMHKREVRALAKKFALPVAQKKDSQGLCFVGDITMSDFLSRYIPLRTGAVLDMQGNAVGEHDGAALYTTGQRHGFRMRSSVPHYVVSADTQANTITVSPDRDDASCTKALLREMHWIRESSDGEYLVQSRYREKPGRAHVLRAESGVCVTLAQAHILAPGQSLVMYRGRECAGGGIISRM